MGPWHRSASGSVAKAMRRGHYVPKPFSAPSIARACVTYVPMHCVFYMAGTASVHYAMPKQDNLNWPAKHGLVSFSGPA